MHCSCLSKLYPFIWIKFWSLSSFSPWIPLGTYSILLPFEEDWAYPFVHFANHNCNSVYRSPTTCETYNWRAVNTIDFNLAVAHLSRGFKIMCNSQNGSINLYIYTSSVFCDFEGKKHFDNHSSVKPFPCGMSLRFRRLFLIPPCCVLKTDISSHSVIKDRGSMCRFRKALCA